MKKKLLSLAIVATINTSVASASETEESILVTANRTQQDQFTVLSATQIITKEQIEKMQAASLADVLSTIAGVSVANNGGAGQQASIFTRGTNSNHTLVLVDGVRVGSATLGTTNFSALSTEQVERIEVVKGPRAALYGSDAIGAVIQVFTKRYDAGEGQVNAGFGSNGLFQGGASYGFGSEQHQYSVNVAFEKADGFNVFESDPNNPYDINEPDEDGYSRQSISLLGRSEFSSELALDVVAKYSQGETDIDASYPDSPCWSDPSQACPSYYANENDHDNYHVRVAGSYVIDGANFVLTISKSQDQGESHGTGLNESPKDKIATKRDQVSFVGDHELSKDTGITYGVDWYSEDVSTNQDKVAWVEGFQQWEVTSRDVKAAFVQGRHQVENFLFEAAGRRDDIEGIGNENTYNLAVGYQVNDNWLVSASKGTGFKAPTFNDLYWPGSGNDTLRPEKSETEELLVRHFDGDLKVELGIYETEVEDLIAWSPNAEGAWQPANINQAKMSGGDISVSFARDIFEHNINLAYVDAEDATTGKALLRRPNWTADYNVAYHFDELTVTTTLSYRDESEDSSRTLDSYWLVDLGAQYQATENLLISAKVNNLFDEEYESVANYIADGTNYRLNLRYQF